ncbi:hypothetical protein VV869_15230 [Photobacterium sp. MCCC 1A19761]|uniref:hypothetical protein n=1 Tax=Photobacterium sp. MCCC 1A19761 TaxID=3115000 RepID=UPI00307F22A0
MQPTTRIRRPDSLQKLFLWLIIFDYLLLTMFLVKLHTLPLNTGSAISLLLVVYNTLLAFLCFRRARRQTDYYIVYPVISATLLALICFLYFFFLLP